MHGNNRGTLGKVEISTIHALPIAKKSPFIGR